MDISDAITFVDETMGLSTPVFVVGYNLVGRSCSIRSALRVLVLMAVVLGSGKSTADVKQAMMRGGGKTVEVRRRNGFAGVRLLCVREDYDVTVRMFGFTSEVLTLDSPGNEWMTHKGYSPASAPVIQTSRPHAKRKLELTLEGAGVVEVTVKVKKGYSSKGLLRAIWDLSDRNNPQATVRRADVKSHYPFDAKSNQAPRSLRRKGFLEFVGQRQDKASGTGIWRLTPAGRAYCLANFGSSSSG